MDLVDFLSQHNIDAIRDGHHHCREGWLQFDCPFCGGQGAGKYHMGFNIRGGYANCWRCGRHTLVEVIAEVAGVSIGQAKGLVTGAGLDTETYPKAVAKPKGKLLLPSGHGPLLRSHRRYLASRGYDADVLETLWELKGIGGTAPKLRWRILIPVISEGKAVSWTTRKINDESDAPRYISAKPEDEDQPLKSVLYGEDYCRTTIVIVEGAFDVWRIGPGAVATCGTGFSRSQINRMVKFPRRVVCFDNEPTAQERARKLCTMLELFNGETFNVQLDAKDASSAPQKEINRLRKSFLRV